MCTLCGEEYDTSYTFWEEVMLSLGNKENKLKKTSLCSKQIKTGTLEHTLEVC